MKAVITGDVINSRKVASALWMTDLKAVLDSYGKEPKDWEIYRGDSFQLVVEAVDALEIAFVIKATVKQHKLLDVRMAIGIGTIDYKTHKITESNGSAFVNSGECFEGLRKQTLGIQTPWPVFDKTFNLILQLTAMFSDNWTSTSAQILKEALQNPTINQNQLASVLNKKSQSSISASLKRAGYEELKNVIAFYKQEIEKQW
ncbi:transcriptional regulator [Flavobacterium acetivorans]|uniref:transcriptional regulator n=1 Tax=Flavobacterium acetivorans TaxID=2893883 RepID=UPI001E5C4249|nr:transcriptional regulator [Flavobacterium sp. F-29]UFH34776.1 transcriptional regulator [Flavobacterium sp. F-29]